MKKQGGKRAGAGRPAEFKEKTKVLNLRVPESKYDEVKPIILEAARKILEGYK